MKAGSKVIVHWSKAFIVGMAYVMLGRCELLDDLYITGEFSAEQIKCDLIYALPEAQRLLEIFENSQREQREQREQCWKISYLNVRSMKSCNGHREDVKSDNLLMDSDLFGLGETWLEKDDQVNYDGFTGYFANFGNGKGVAAYNKIDLIAQPVTVSKETYSAIFMKTKDFHVIFLYLSSNYDKNCLFALLDIWIEKDVPTAVLGDVNEDLLKMKKIAFEKKMAKKGFHQLIKEPTCVTGSLIDHIYVNDAMKARGISTAIDSAYYSDHDQLSLFVQKLK